MNTEVVEGIWVSRRYKILMMMMRRRRRRRTHKKQVQIHTLVNYKCY
jgi:hypothetical protein